MIIFALELSCLEEIYHYEWSERALQENVVILIPSLDIHKWAAKIESLAVSYFLWQVIVTLVSPGHIKVSLTLWQLKGKRAAFDVVDYFEISFPYTVRGRV